MEKHRQRLPIAETPNRRGWTCVPLASCRGGAGAIVCSRHLVAGAAILGVGGTVGGARAAGAGGRAVARLDLHRRAGQPLERRVLQRAAGVRPPTGPGVSPPRRRAALLRARNHARRPDADGAGVRPGAERADLHRQHLSRYRPLACRRRSTRRLRARRRRPAEGRDCARQQRPPDRRRSRAGPRPVRRGASRPPPR